MFCIHRSYACDLVFVRLTSNCDSLSQCVCTISCFMSGTSAMTDTIIRSTETNGSSIDASRWSLSSIWLRVQPTAAKMSFEEHQVIVWNDAMRRILCQRCCNTVVHRKISAISVRRRWQFGEIRKQNEIAVRVGVAIAETDYSTIYLQKTVWQRR